MPSHASIQVDMSKLIRNMLKLEANIDDVNRVSANITKTLSRNVYSQLEAEAIARKDEGDMLDSLELYIDERPYAALASVGFYKENNEQGFDNAIYLEYGRYRNGNIDSPKPFIRPIRLAALSKARYLRKNIEKILEKGEMLF